MKNWKPIVILALFIAVCFVAVGAGAVFTSNSVSNWYPTLRKPSWNPPAWIFGPVWTVLYLMMAIAAAGVIVQWRQGLRIHRELEPRIEDIDRELEGFETGVA